MRRRLAVLALISWSVAACSGGGAPERDESGALIEGGTVSAFDLQIGDCFTPPDDLGDRVEELDVVPCTDGHTHEVFDIVAYDGTDDVYPGETALTSFAQTGCIASFTDYVGEDYFESDLFVTFLLPTLDGWNDDGDDEIVCLAFSTGEPLTASVHDRGEVSGGEVSDTDGEGQSETSS